MGRNQYHKSCVRRISPHFSGTCLAHRIVIPKQLIEELGWDSHADVQFRVVGDHMTMSLAKEEA